MADSDDVISCHEVSKRYGLRRRGLFQRLLGLQSRADSVPAKEGSPDPDERWAVRDLSLAIRQGETVGIIGRNGSGKSTLLKLLAGITPPTSGQIAVKGRVASLIELGAGFHPELSGRENIYLNGAVHGLSRREIDDRFEDIVAFSGLRDSLEMPVKCYSSGMYARLGFAVATHIDADVLLTDEILAVGDAAFQRQCLQKFHELRQRATVVVVSHDLTTMKRVCSRLVWLHKGHVEQSGQPDKVIEAYLDAVQSEREGELKKAGGFATHGSESRWGSGQVQIDEISILDGSGQARRVFRTGEDVLVRLGVHATEALDDVGFGVQIWSSDDRVLHGTNTFIVGQRIVLGPGPGTIELRYQHLPLLAGTYWLTVGATRGNDWSVPLDLREKVVRFEVLTSQLEAGMMTLTHHWGAHVSA
jgi:ABC-type polysaccharide/polyol phosphate transport system ATPase subunit